MSDPSYRPLDVVAAMAALGIHEDLQDAFYDAAEDYVTMNIKQANDALKAANLKTRDRMAV
ncbi:MAG: hypothetical protein P4L87_00265, partial [Formivibrio sp.]|nr:hypothetical protein [Formivibrio sp.]